MAKYDSDRIFLERIKESMLKTLDELEARMDELNDQVSFLENAINAIHVYERVNPVSEPVTPPAPEVPDEKA